jgi:BirA family transcriptional regulator, biotin operon repressor / biotin---[acetyl-CoA-carboxylase] ligase
MPASLAPEAVEPLLRGRFGHVYVYEERCPSTQRLLPEDAPEGAVAVAEEQTEGRGRIGRRWEAPPRSSVLCSVCLRPDAPPARYPELTLVGAEATVEAIRARTALAPTVKEPNDVLLADRKVAGVLGEAFEGRVVLGIGINVNVPADQLPREARLPPTSLLLETGGEIDRAELLVTLLEELERAYGRWIARL